MKFKNNTSQRQQIIFANGLGQDVLPGVEIDVDPSSVYAEEYSRLSSILTPVEEELKPKKREYNKRSFSFDKDETDVVKENEGGNE